MAKTAVVFVVTMVVLFSIQTTLAQDDSSTDTILSQLNLDEAASQVQDAMSALSNTEEESESTTEVSPSPGWTNWLKTKMENAGIISASSPSSESSVLSSPTTNSGPASAPAQAPRSQGTRSQAKAPSSQAQAPSS